MVSGGPHKIAVEDRASPRFGAIAGQLAAIHPLPSRRTLHWARILTWREASGAVLGDMIFEDLDVIRNRFADVWWELADWPFVCLAALAIACPEVPVGRLASCLGLDPMTAPSLMASKRLTKGWRVLAIRKVVAELRAKGVEFQGAPS